MTRIVWTVFHFALLDVGGVLNYTQTYLKTLSDNLDIGGLKLWPIVSLKLLATHVDFLMTILWVIFKLDN